MKRSRRKFIAAAVTGALASVGAAPLAKASGINEASSGLGYVSQSQKTLYNIIDFGAVGDGVTINTAAINKAVDKCSENGGGMVVFPQGVFLSGTIMMKSNVEIHLEMGSTLLASTEHKDFPSQTPPAYRSLVDKAGWNALIYAEGKTNIAITGFGTINGNGAQQKPVPGTLGGDRDGRPRNILFISCNYIRIEGIRMLHSGLWNQHYLNCEDVIVNRIEVFNHANRNNDAIDIDGCRRFVLANSIFDSDDDGITLKSTGAAASEDIAITNCVVSSFCNAIKTGTESTGGFRNITISNCIVKPSRSTSNPVFKTPRHGVTGISLIIVDGGVMEGVSISNITIEGTACPLYIRLGNRARKHTDDAPEPPRGVMRNISISNLVAYNTGNFSNSITGVPGQNVENLTIDNVQFFNRGGLKDGEYKATHQDVPEDEKGYPQPTVWGNLPSSTLFIRHVRGLSVNNLMFGSEQYDPRAPIVAFNVEKMRIGKSIFSGKTPLPPVYALLTDVKEYEIEKPLGWGENPLIDQI